MACGRSLRWTALLLMAGCIGCSVAPLRPSHFDACERLYRRVDAAVIAAGVADHQAARIPGYPYLRVNRFLAELNPLKATASPETATVPASPQVLSQWLAQLRELDRRARRAETANLPAARHGQRWEARLERCARRMLAHDAVDPAAHRRLRHVGVPSSYQPVRRLIGLYPVTSLLFLDGVRRLHRRTARSYAMPLQELPVRGSLQRFAPPPPARRLSPGQVAARLAAASRNALRLPVPGAEILDELFASFAPVWEIDVASPADQPGRPRLTPGGVAVDGVPTVYTLVSHARWGGHNLLQLNYVMWFPARPPQGRFDLAAGRLDGLIWRVTLGPEGQPLLFDAVHNCGCYHLVFPTPRVEARWQRRGWEEPVAIPQTVPPGRQRLVLRVAAGDHALQRVYRESSHEVAAVSYGLADYDALRSLALDTNGRRSLFGEHGLVPGTERAERWLFWPMGVREPGAMRQWGNHAVAFVGRRHFDDPRLFERYFREKGKEGNGR